jgi:acyl-CoA synthetase (NDP forming)
MASGFAETADPDGHRLQQRMLADAHASGMRIIGPNSQGLASFDTGAVLGFSTMFTEQAPLDGPVAVISQSGAMCSVPYGMLRRRGIGVRYAHGTGNDADLTVGELAEAVVSDPEIRLLLLYLEDIRDPRPLERAARAAMAAGTPVVVLMGGRSADGQRAAASHTGALANEQRVVDAFFERCGIWRSRNVVELVAATELYLRGWKPRGKSLAVVSNSGAVCVLAADAASDQGLPLAQLSERTTAGLERALPTFATKSNPIDITAALLTDSSLFGKVLPLLSADDSVDACFLGLPVSGKGYDVQRFAADARAYADQGGTILVATPQPDVAGVFRRQEMVVFEEEASALAALSQFLRHHELIAAAATQKPPVPRHLEATCTLNESDSLELLSSLGLPVVPYVLCPDAASTAKAFEEFGGSPVAVKGCTSQATHKSELGLVHLNVNTAEDARHAAEDALESLRIAGLEPDGVLVAPMVPALREVILGAHLDPVFGPVVIVGAGGKYVEVLPDVQLLLAPFDHEAALAAIARLTMAPLLKGVRGESPADVDAWAAAAVRLGDAMVAPASTLVSVDANPLMLGAAGAARSAVIVDAVVQVASGRGAA